MLAISTIRSGLRPMGARVCGVVWNRSYSSVGAEVQRENLEGENEGITVLTLNRPKGMNSLSRKFLQEIKEHADAIRFDQSVRVVVLKSALEKVFCAGADLKERATMSETEVSEFLYKLRGTFTEIENLPMPTIACINGAALGGGLELALACDLRVAGPRSKLGLPETRLAIIPGAGGTQRLPRTIGVPKAKELIFTGKILTAEKAEQIGLITEAVTEGDPLDKALELARNILPAGPVALRMAKQAISQGSEVEQAVGMAIEQACYAQVIPTQDRTEGLTAFREKRKPVYIGK
ncbi:hypothetical protein SARC_04412 [Sphaeroforma arctica JP610]|uniref:Methylglutaconyl-CoA hydratase n=1 Tax=Sphaeroforma arctica JP610 TaxID=667725 RepID=A0A0L0G399_9EUKA|nr:hypothetical protein SARC_04412 [Sphaeroforma arctica JP610]KNC83316.1 hypothetical protein SARC_04412 [Sphaeroforma arctica JP610]|eukprot:XP_014157218.1 hypothetical protein SARC_04412 [Sphaeroforma arctica JP610]